MTKPKIASKFLKKSGKLKVVQTSPEVDREMKEIDDILITENGFSPAFEDVIIKAASEDQPSPQFVDAEDAIGYLHRAQLVELEQNRVDDKLRVEAEKAKKLPKSEFTDI